MSTKRYIKYCAYCGKKYVAKTTKSLYDSDKCKNAFNRKKEVRSSGIKKEKPSDSGGQLVEIPTQKKVIKPATRGRYPSLMKPIKLYTEQDLWILVGKLCGLELGGGSSLLHDLYIEQQSELIIQDFEKRFNCHFKQVKEDNPKIYPPKTKEERAFIAEHFRRLEYSR